MSDIAKGDFNDFSVKLHGKNHTFQALNKNERDAWIVSLEPRIADAKAHRETLMATPGYKSALEKYSTPDHCLTQSSVTMLTVFQASQQLRAPSASRGLFPDPERRASRTSASRKPLRIPQLSVQLLQPRPLSTPLLHPRLVS